jgi:CSLREA domain-containing protein
MSRSAFSFFSAFVVVALFLAPVQGAHSTHSLAVGTTFVVNSTADLPDSDVGDGVCHASNGLCTLRAAIQQANFSTGADTINLPAGVFLLTRPGLDDGAVLGDLDITDSVTIHGAGSGVTIVDGNGAVTGDRVFQILSSATNTTISGLTMRNGKRTGTFDKAGGLYWDGSGGSHLSLQNVEVANNAAYYGGGLFLNYSINGDTVDLGHLAVHNNSVTAAGGGVAASFTDFAVFNLHDSQVYNNNGGNQGGGVYFQNQSPTITSFSVGITNSLIYSNTANLYGGLENDAGSATFPVTLQNSKLYLNHANFNGGAIGNSGGLVITTSTLDANTAAASGGGIYDGDGGVININQSTLSRNTAMTGGGIYSEFFIHNAAGLVLTNSTLSSNSASQDGAGFYADGGVIQLYNATISSNKVLVPAGSVYAGKGGGIYLSSRVGITLENALIANNTHRYGTALAVPDDCFGAVTSLGYNLIQDTAACTIGGDTTGDIIGLDPKLSPLQNTFGPTQVQVPLRGSPAIDAGQTPACTDVNSAALVIDQRGVTRLLGGRCDIGAVENLPITQYMPFVRK